MGNEIIAEKFALLRTKGGNGVSYTHLVEDTLTGRKAIVKISDRLGLLGFEYLKTINILKEIELPGILLPFEAGMLEEESDYYFAFPELGEPSLEDLFRIGVPLTCQEALEIVNEILLFLDGLHKAGFCHLFINTRNIFFRPHGSVTLKDPALKAEFFQPLLELIAAPDFSYFSPEVMDGGQPDASADIYAVGTLIERLLEEVTDPRSSAAETLRSVAEKCHATWAPGNDIDAAEISALVFRSNPLYGDVRGGGQQQESRRIEILDESGGRRKKHRKASGQEGELAIKRRPRSLFRILAGVLSVAALLAILALSMRFIAKPDHEPLLSAADSRGEAEDAGLGSQAGPGDQDGGAYLDNPVATEEPEQAAEPTVAVKEDANQSSAGQNPASSAPPSQPAAQPVADASPAAPVASFSISPASGQSPLQVYLDASSSYDPDGKIVSYSWSCGGQGKASFHVFESNVVPNSIAITLTVTDNAGHRSSTTRQVTLY
jgi:serine/threonine protein kinase